MATALLYDVHGNLPALDAVLADAEAQGATDYVLGGDYAVFGGWPAETVERLRGLPAARWLRGNVDRWTANPSSAPDDPVVREALRACREALGDALVAELAGLPERLTAGDALFVHASPVSDVRSFPPEPAEQDAELLDGVTARRLVFGHTHLPFRREAASGVELINPGSVGMPFDGDLRAAYAIVRDDGALEHRRVGYDHEAAVDRLAEAFGDSAFTRTVCERLRRAAFDVQGAR